MAVRIKPGGGTQAPLSRERVLRAAVSLADVRGIESLTMRNLAEALGVEAMSLYHHVANKEAVLDGVVEVVMSETVRVVDASPVDGWKTAMRTRILAAHHALHALGSRALGLTQELFKPDVGRAPSQHGGPRRSRQRHEKPPVLRGPRLGTGRTRGSWRCTHLHSRRWPPRPPRYRSPAPEWTAA